MPDDARALGSARRAVFGALRRAGEAEWIQASGASMRPLVEPGDWMYVEFGRSAPHVGEIALFELDGLIVAHRVVGERSRDGRRLLVCKGDAVAFCDPLVAPGDVLGVVRAVRPAAGGPPRTRGCAGADSRVPAHVSRWCGRWAWWARRGAALLPRRGGARGAGLVAHAGLTITQVAARAARAGA